jgi:hypothetical protein
MAESREQRRGDFLVHWLSSASRICMSGHCGLGNDESLSTEWLASIHDRGAVPSRDRLDRVAPSPILRTVDAVRSIG